MEPQTNAGQWLYQLMLGGIAAVEHEAAQEIDVDRLKRALAATVRIDAYRDPSGAFRALVAEPGYRGVATAIAKAYREGAG